MKTHIEIRLDEIAGYLRLLAAIAEKPDRCCLLPDLQQECKLKADQAKEAVEIPRKAKGKAGQR